MSEAVGGIVASAALAAAARRLAAAGLPTARLDARLLLAHAQGRGNDHGHAIDGDRLMPAVAEVFVALIDRRAAGEPVARIRGHREFWSLNFRLGPDTLDPRPDSETVVAAALELAAGRAAPLRLLDLGTGTGCLLLPLLHELPAAQGVGVDIAAGAIAVARQNAWALGLAPRAQFAVGDWTRCLRGRFDIVVANPPYIPDADIEGLMPEVRDHDPRRALAGGRDGLDAYRAIAADLRRVMAASGHAAFEVGAGQTDAVVAIMVEAGLKPSCIRADLAGVPRCVVFGP